MTDRCHVGQRGRSAGPKSALGSGRPVAPPASLLCFIRRAKCTSLRPHEQAVEIGNRGSWHCRQRAVAALGGAWTPPRAKPRPHDRGGGRVGAVAQQEALRAARGARMVRGARGAGRRPGHRRVRRADRWRRRGAQEGGRGGARCGQAGRHRQQGAARPPRHRACQARREGGRGPQLRGGGGGRHPRHQDAARGARRQSDPPRLRHPQRHLQLHPHQDAGRAALVRRRAGRGAGQGLRRGRSRPSTSAASTPPTSSPSSPASRSARASPSIRSTSRASRPSPRPTSRPPTTSATASSSWASPS